MIWNFATLASGASVNVSFSATVDTGATALNPITNTGSLVSLDQSEDNPANNAGNVDINVVGLDIEVLKAVDEPSPVEGNSVVYTITVNNLSGQTATNVRISDIVPNGTTYVPSSIAGGTAQNDAAPDTTGLIWDIASLAGGGSTTLTFSASVDAGAQAAFGTITNTASLVSVDQTEDVPANNSGSVDIVVQTFDVAVAKTVNNATPEEGETVTYTITATNTTAGVTGTNIVINDIVPDGLTYVPGSIAGGDVRDDLSPDAGNGLTWTISSLAGLSLIHI